MVVCTQAPPPQDPLSPSGPPAAAPSLVRYAAHRGGRPTDSDGDAVARQALLVSVSGREGSSEGVGG